MVSSPAIERSKVDLPQPEGPTSTTNSPSAISRSIDCRTVTGPNFLWTLRKDTEAIYLSFDGAGSESGHQIALQEEEEEADRNERQHRRRHHLPPVDREFANEGEEPDGKGLLALAVDQHEAEQQFAPGGGEDKGDGGAHAGQRQGQDDAPQRRKAGAAIDHRRLFQVLGDAIEKGLHQESGEGDV